MDLHLHKGIEIVIYTPVIIIVCVRERERERDLQRKHATPCDPHAPLVPANPVSSAGVGELKLN